MLDHEAVKTETQFSVFLVNKPGVLARVVQSLADQKINIVALSMMDSTEHGVLRLVVSQPQQAREALSNLDVHKTETTVLLAALPNRPGALADMMERLALEHINVHYAYCTTGASGGKTIGVFKVSDQNKAIQVLSERKPRRKTTLSTPRAAPRRR
jgi:hypothetical protein